MPQPWNIDITGQPGNPGGPRGPIGPGYLATSVTNLPIATGPITVTTQAGLAYLPGDRVRLASNSAPTQWMEGLVTSYSVVTLSVNIDLTSQSSQTLTTFPAMPNYLGGLILANDSVTPATVLDIGLGGATSDDNSTLMMLATPGFTKTCTAAWATGSGNGGLDNLAGAALANSTWYYVFLIERTDTQIVDVLISLSATAPVLPPNYTKKRRIGAFVTNASAQIVPFSQFGDKFYWRTPVENYTNLTMPTAVTALVVSVPPGIQVEAQIHVYFATSTACYFTLWSPDQTGCGLNIPNGNITIYGWANGAILTLDMSVRTNTSQNVMIQASAAATGFYLTTNGWIDYRGK